MESNPLTEDQHQALRRLPAVEILLSHPFLQTSLSQYVREYVVAGIRMVLEEARRSIRLGELQDVSTDELVLRVIDVLEARSCTHLTRVINLTGTVTHTNLGRSLLGVEACQHLSQVASHYTNLEFDVETGKRGHRDSIIEPPLRELTDCEAATVVNNNAAAVLLVLNTLAKEKEVIVSRGELIEIGGSFRIPEVMLASQAILREVGTTNRTYIRDYERAINEHTALLLKVHPSNYKVEGFSETPSMEEIVSLGQRTGIPTVEDLGSGALIDLRELGLPYEPVVKERIQAGVDVVTFSGDKLLGGPQAGIIVGKKALIDQIRLNPLMRALRVGKLTLSALESTLQSYFGPFELLPERLPMLGFLTRNIKDVWQIAEHVADQLRTSFEDLKVLVQIEDTRAQIGSGSLPVDLLPSACVILHPIEISVEWLASQLRSWRVPILGRIQDGRLYLDMRTVRDEDMPEIFSATQAIAGSMRRKTCAM